MKRYFITFISLCLFSCIACGTISAGDGKVLYNGTVLAGGASVFSKQGQGSLVSIETCHGIEIGKRGFCGIGTGASYSIATNEVLIPVFMTGAISLSDRPVKPIVGTRIGALLNTERNSNMISLIPFVGIEYSKLVLSFGYEFLGAVDKDWGNVGMGSYGRIRTYTNSNGLRLTIGVKFR